MPAEGACIRITPERLLFGDAPIGQITRRPIFIESCGDEPLIITDVALADDSGPEFLLDAAQLPGFPLQLPAATPNEPAPSQGVVVEFRPQAEARSQGAVIIGSNDSRHPREEVRLDGRGAEQGCPTAAVGRAQINVEPLQLIELDGSPSRSFRGDEDPPLTYAWAVVTRPEGSTREPISDPGGPMRHHDRGRPADPRSPSAWYYLDVAGTYVFELQVTDAQGATAPGDQCAQPPARVTVRAVPTPDVYIEVTWQTPGDPDETDQSGTDVDLHLRHPQGEAWAVAPWDCYFANTAPDWGPAGPEGNPSLVVDAVSGAGPEVIVVNAPENTDLLRSPYLVGVHYYRAEDQITGLNYGPSEVLLRVYFRGVLAGEHRRELRSTGHFWEAVGIHWTPAAPRVELIDAYHERQP